MRCAGLLLTGGASSRFGRDKATARFDGQTLAGRAARALTAVAAPVIEVGPGVSGLDHVDDDRQGPLVALATGLLHLPADMPVIVLACDLPLVTPSLVRWLADHPAEGSVVPVAGGPPLPQPLCARWSATALAAVPDLVAGGERSLRPLVAGPDVTLVPAGEWEAELEDVDTPEAFDALLRRRLRR
jgi:molybdenum cofactor guanylyltransferase